MSINQLLLNALESWRLKASAYASTDRIGHAMARTFDVMSAVVKEGVTSETVAELSEMLERDRTFAMNKDSKDPSVPLLVPRDFVYGLMESFGSLIPVIVNQCKEIQELSAHDYQDSKDNVALLEDDSRSLVDIGIVKGEPDSVDPLEETVGDREEHVMNGDNDEDNVEVKIEENDLAASAETPGTSKKASRKRTRISYALMDADANSDEEPASKHDCSEKKKKHQCEICPRSFDYPNNLASHRYTHTGERPHKCHICGAGFAQIGNMNKHLRQEHEIKVFKCTKCDKHFEKHDQLKMHFKDSKTCVRQYECSKCFYSCTLARNLYIHLRDRHGEKPFECTDCGMKFRLSTELTEHSSLEKHGRYAERN